MKHKCKLIISAILFIITLIIAIITGIIGVFWQTDVLSKYITVKILSSILLLAVGFIIGIVFIMFEWGKAMNETSKFAVVEKHF